MQHYIRPRAPSAEAVSQSNADHFPLFLPPSVYPERIPRWAPSAPPRTSALNSSFFSSSCKLPTADCQLSSPNSFPSHAYARLADNSCISHGYAKTRGVPPPQKCRRADIFNFSPAILHFSRAPCEMRRKVAQASLPVRGWLPLDPGAQPGMPALPNARRWLA